MEVLNDYVRHLPTLKDSPKAVSMTKKWNVPFGEADLAPIVLASVPTLRQNQYNLNHTTVLELMHVLLPDLEAIEHIMVEKQNKKLKAKGKAATAKPEAKGNPQRKAYGGPIGRVPRSFASIARAMAVPTRPTTPWTAVNMTAMVSPMRQQEAIRAWLLCSTCLRLMRRAKKTR
jgi:hypothetical protein